MSARVSGGDVRGTIETAQEALGSAASSTYDAGARAARYVGATTSEHPFPVLAGVAIAAAVLGGLLSTAARGNGRQDWQKHSRKARERGRDLADDAGDHVYRAVSENPMSSLAAAAALVGALGFLLGRR